MKVFFALFLSVVLFAGCKKPEQAELEKGQSEIKKENFHIALTHFDKVLLRAPASDQALEAAREAAKATFFNIKDFERAIRYYKFLVLRSSDAEERLLSQKQLIAIYFDHLTNYPQAIIEINKIITMLENPNEKTEYKIKLARAYYYQNNFLQAENEIDEFLKKEPPGELKFDLLLLKANVNLAKKEVLKAVEILKMLLKDFPERANKENIGTTLSVCYEELKDFKSALAVLEQVKAIHAVPEYVDIRIKRLQERLKNQPGAKGKFRK